VRFAIGVPNVGAYGDPGLLVELGGMAEQSGWDGVFMWDHVAYREPDWPVADPQVAVVALAASTKHVRLGVLMVALPRRRPCFSLRASRRDAWERLSAICSAQATGRTTLCKRVRQENAGEPTRVDASTTYA
jgi:hypothetical protein